jgi:opacity protein-like surface antigen
MLRKKIYLNLFCSSTFLIKWVLFICIYLFYTSIASAQNFHFSANIGAANYYGELQEKVFTFNQPGVAVGVGLTYEITAQLNARANVTFAKVNGADAQSIKSKDRNLSFSSPITELSVGLQYDFLNLYNSSISPYVFVGVAVFKFNPSTIDSLGKKTFLQPLSTEGQGFVTGVNKYKLTDFSIPFGGGLRFAINDDVRLGAEVGIRKTFTDYIDDVSGFYADETALLLNRGPKAVELAFRGDELNKGLTNPGAANNRGSIKSKDWYYFSTISLSFRIKSKQSSRTSHGKSRVDCPRKF